MLAARIPRVIDNHRQRTIGAVQVTGIAATTGATGEVYVVNLAFNFERLPMYVEWHLVISVLSTASRVMQASTPSWRRWLRFGLSHLFVLTLGIALGFAPLNLWELNTRGEPRIAAHVKAIEVPRGELASLGIGPQQSVGGIPLASLDRSFNERLKSLLHAGRARVLAEPVLMTVSGRSSVFKVGGEIPMTVANPNGTEWLDYREFGTDLILTPQLLRNGRIRVDFFSQISTAEEVANEDSSKPPGISRNQTQTELDLASGETVVVCANSYIRATGEEVSLLILATVERDKVR